MNTHTYTAYRLQRNWINGTISLCELKGQRDQLQKKLDKLQKEAAVLEEELSGMPVHCDCYECRNDPNNH